MAKPVPAKQVLDAPEGHGGAEAPLRIRSAYDRSRVSVPCICLESEDRTRQSFKDECDINVLMKRYEKTGIVPVGRELPPQYADVSSLDFDSSMQRVAAVSGVFSMLDARTRARFENSPAQMLDFLADPGNLDEAVKMGLMAKPKGDSDGSGKAVAGVGGAGQVGEADSAGEKSERGAAASGGAASGDAAAAAGGGEGGRGREAALGHRST